MIPHLRTMILVLVLAGTPTVGRGEWREFGILDGLPDAEVHDILEDRNGAIWVAAGGGLSVHDGSSAAWRLLTDSPTLVLEEDALGRVWSASADGVFRHEGASRVLVLPRPPEEPGFLDIAASRSGTVWIARYDGRSLSRTLHRFDHEGRTDLTSPVGVQVLFVDRDDRLWVGGASINGVVGVARLDGSSWSTYISGDGRDDILVRTLLQDRSGRLWAGGSVAAGRGRQAIVDVFEGVGWRRYSAPDGISGDEVLVLFEDSRGTIWAGGVGGIYRFDGTSWTAYTEADGVPVGYDGAPNCTAILETGHGHLLFGGGAPLPGRNIVRFDGHRFLTALPPDLTVNGRVLFSDRDGGLWTGVGNAPGLLRSDHASTTLFTSEEGLPGDAAFELVPDREGNLWARIESRGLARFDGRGWTTFNTGNGLLSDSTTTLVIDRSGDLWVAYGTHAAGVSRRHGGVWTTYTTADGMADGQVRSFHVGPTGQVWAQSATSISRWDGQSWSSFATGDLCVAFQTQQPLLETRGGELWVATGECGTSENSGIRRYDVDTGAWTDLDRRIWVAANRGLLEDRSGRVWVADVRGFLLRFDGTDWDSIAVAPEVGIGWVYDLFEDRDGDLWIGTSSNAPQVSIMRLGPNGIERFTGRDGLALDDVVNIAEDSRGQLWATGRTLTSATSVARFDGERWRAYQPFRGGTAGYSIYFAEDSSGALWFSSWGDGLSRIEPDLVSPRTVSLTKPPPVSGSPAATASFIPAFGESRGVEFSHRLDGGPWSAWSAVGSWSALNLSDGTHRLEARSRDPEGNVEMPGVLSEFEIDAEPPLPLLIEPAFGQAIGGVVSVRGAAEDPRFASYRVEVRRTGSGTWDGARVLVHSTTPVPAGGVLATWDTSDLPDANYDLRVSVEDTLGLSGTLLVTVLVDNAFPFADQTAPVVVTSTRGGDVFTNEGDLHLYVPPYAFVEDALVSITRFEGPPDTLGDGAVRVTSSFLVNWSTPLGKPGTLAFAAGHLPAGPVAIYRALGNGDWSRLGGSRDDASVRLAVADPGEYALFLEAAPPVGGASTLEALSFTPRVFSPDGTFARRDVAIAFTLGSAAPVTVSVFNRAGRLVREVADGVWMGPGAAIVRWDGMDRAGAPAMDGLYVVTVESSGKRIQGTIAVVR